MHGFLKSFCTGLSEGLSDCICNSIRSTPPFYHNKGMCYIQTEIHPMSPYIKDSNGKFFLLYYPRKGIFLHGIFLLHYPRLITRHDRTRKLDAIEETENPLYGHTIVPTKWKTLWKFTHVHYIGMSHDYYTFCSTLKTSYDLQTNKIAHLRDVYFPITLCGWKTSLATFS